MCASTVLAPDRSGLKLESPCAVKRRPDHPVSGPLLDRHRLSGDHGFVHGRGAIGDCAVDRDLLSGPDDNHIPRNYVHDRDIKLGDSAHDARGLRLKPDQFFDRLGRMPLGPHLKQAAKQYEDDDRGRGVVVDVRGVALDREDRREKGGYDAVNERCRGADRDERVHVGRAVARGRYRAWSRIARLSRTGSGSRV